MKVRKLTMAVIAVGSAFTLVACSSGSDTATEATASAEAPAATEEGAAAGDDLVAAAKEKCDAGKAVPSTENLGEPIDIKSLAGKTVISIPIDSKLEFYQVGEDAMKAVAEKAGIKYVTFPSDGTQTSYQQGFQQAINSKAGAILLNGPLPETLAPQVEEAVAAGIPVIPLHLSDSTEEALPNLPYEAFAPFNASAEVMTYCAIADLNGEPINALVIEASETGPSAGMVQTIQDVIANGAPAGSTATVINQPVTKWATDIQPAVQSALVADPSINTVLPIYDSMALFAAPGIEQAAPDKGIGIYTFNGTPAVMAMIPDGIVRVDVAENPDWVAYVNMDTAFRAMLGVPPTPQASGPIRVIDASNVAETGNPPEASKGFGDEYPAAYLQLWGLG
jgi:ribose transport system substrate-binding protein